MSFPLSSVQQASFPHRHFAFRTAAAGTLVGTAAVAVALFFPAHNLPRSVPLAGATLVLGGLFWLHGRFLRWSREEVLRTQLCLVGRDRELRSFFNNAFDAILIFDDQLTCREANPAAAQLFGVDQHRLVGRSVKELVVDPVSICCLRKKMPGGTPHHGRLELTRSNGSRVAAEFTFRTGPDGVHHLLTLRDDTVMGRARKANQRSLAVARAGIVEAHLLHRATIALSRVGPLNAVLDNLLDILHTAIPCENARILVLEGPTRLFLARQKSWANGGEAHAPCSDTIDLGAFPLLRRLLEEPSGILLRDIGVTDGRNASSLGSSPCWLGVPLYTGERALGFLILTHSSAGLLTSEHLRLAATIARPLALAVCNARLLERAEIFRAQLSYRLSDLPPV